MYMYLCIHICIYVNMSKLMMCRCLHMFRFIPTYLHTHTYIRAYIHTYIHTYIHRYMHAYVYTHIYRYTCIYICIYIYTFMYILHAELRQSCSTFSAASTSRAPHMRASASCSNSFSWPNLYVANPHQTAAANNNWLKSPLGLPSKPVLVSKHLDGDKQAEATGIDSFRKRCPIQVLMRMFLTLSPNPQPGTA